MNKEGPFCRSEKSESPFNCQERERETVYLDIFCRKNVKTILLTLNKVFFLEWKEEKEEKRGIYGRACEGRKEGGRNILARFAAARFDGSSLALLAGIKGLSFFLSLLYSQGGGRTIACLCA